MESAMRRLALLLPLLVLPALASAQGPEYRAPVERPRAPAASPAAPAPAPADQPGQPKFPNKDTAKNRQDYEMGTGTGAIGIGRDERTGEDVMIHAPARRPARQEPEPPIEVKPVVPLIWKK